VISPPFAAPPAEATEAAVELLRRTFSGDTTCSLLKFLQDVDDEPWAGDFIHATLRLCRALAKRNRSDDGMLALYVSLHNVEATDPNPKRRWAARLILAPHSPPMPPTSNLSGTSESTPPWNTDSHLIYP
jgi:hypothetical protein